MSAERDGPKAASARALRHPDDEAVTAAWEEIDYNDLHEALRGPVRAHAAKLGLSVVRCKWHRSVSNPGRFMSPYLGAWDRRKGAYIAAKLETLPGLLTALHNARARPIWEGHDAANDEAEEEYEEEAADEEEEIADEQDVPLPRKARNAVAAQWALLLALLALLAFRPAPAAAITSLASGLLDPFQVSVPAFFQRKPTASADVTAGWPAELRCLEAQAQASSENVVSLLNLNETSKLMAMANTVHRAPRARKERLTESCASRLAEIRQEVVAELAAIVAGVQAGQPLVSEPLVAAMRRGNSTLEAMAASCAASVDAVDEEIKRIVRVMHILDKHRELLELSAAAAAEDGA